LTGGWLIIRVLNLWRNITLYALIAYYGAGVSYMTCCTFNHGSWLDKWPLSVQKNDEAADEWFDRLEFYLIKTFPGEKIVVFRGDHEFCNQFIVELNLGDSPVDYVYFPDFPSYMIFLREYAAAILM
jgi:hypothetical protein